MIILKNTEKEYEIRIKRIPRDIQQQIRARHVLRLKEIIGDDSEESFASELRKIKITDEYNAWLVKQAQPEIEGVDDLDSWIENNPEFVTPLANLIIQDLQPRIVETKEKNPIDTKKNSALNASVKT